MKHSNFLAELQCYDFFSFIKLKNFPDKRNYKNILIQYIGNFGEKKQ